MVLYVTPRDFPVPIYRPEDVPHVLDVMPWDVPYRHLGDIPADVIKTSPYGLIFNSKGRVLPTS